MGKIGIAIEHGTYCAWLVWKNVSRSSVHLVTTSSLHRKAQLFRYYCACVCVWGGMGGYDNIDMVTLDRYHFQWFLNRKNGIAQQIGNHYARFTHFDLAKTSTANHNI